MPKRKVATDNKLRAACGVVDTATPRSLASPTLSKKGLAP